MPIVRRDMLKSHYIRDFKPNKNSKTWSKEKDYLPTKSSSNLSCSGTIGIKKHKTFNNEHEVRQCNGNESIFIKKLIIEYKF